MPKAKLAKTYQELKSELDAAMAALQSENIDVDEALRHYEHGLELLRAIEAYLKTAENKISQLKTKFKDE